MNAPNFDIEADVRGTIGLIALRGDLDLATAPALDEAVRRLEGESIDELVLDLRGLDFVDSSGLHVFVSLDARAREEGLDVRFVRPGEEAFRTFELTGLAEHFAFVDDPGTLPGPAA